MKMKQYFLLSMILAIVSLSVAKPKGPGGCLSGMHHHHHHGFLHHFSPMCVGQAIAIPDDMKMTLIECHNNTFSSLRTAKEPPSQDKRACDIVCGAKGLGLLDKDGKPVDRNTAEKIITPIIPKEVAGKVLDALSTCVQKHGNNLMIKENDCGSYKNLIECIIMSGREVCGISPPPLF